jgi:hypothetical protein
MNCPSFYRAAWETCNTTRISLSARKHNQKKKEVMAVRFCPTPKLLLILLLAFFFCIRWFFCFMLCVFVCMSVWLVDLRTR